MGNTIQCVSRPYVGQGARNLGDIKQVSDKKPSDVTSPATPELRRAWAFELAADGSNLVPPPPAGRPGKDPLVIELGEIEVGTRIELISLSDNPAAEFTDTCKGEIFELPLSGYNVQQRVGTIALNEDQMKEKGIAPGERFMLRQVDKDGNASEAIHVHLDPNGWANQNIQEPVQGGGTQNVRGANIDIAVGVHGLQGNPNPGTTERILGKATTDTTAPKLLESNVSVKTDTMTKKEFEALKAFIPAMTTLIGGANYEFSHIEQTLKSKAAGWISIPQYKPHVEFLQALVKDPALFRRLSDFTNTRAGNGPGQGYVEFNMANQLAQGAEPPSMTTVNFDKALEPGVRVTVQNSRTGESLRGTQATNGRALSLVLNDVKNGDPLIVTYTDAHGNAGAPYGFNFSDAAKDGKAKTNPLDIRLGGFALKPKPAPSPAS
jgi:hypothetical protein